MLTNVRILGARKLDAFFFKRTFGSRFFAENIWVQIWLIVAHMDLQPDNTYLNNQRLAFERTQMLIMRTLLKGEVNQNILVHGAFIFLHL